MKNALHLMLDLETLGTGSNAIITQIGMCEFFPFAETLYHAPLEFAAHNVGARICIPVNVLAQRAARESDVNTIAWWEKTNKEFYLRMIDESWGEQPENAVQDMLAFLNSVTIGRGSELLIWSRGTNFDPVLIESFWRDFDPHSHPTWPWKYDSWCDVRTVLRVTTDDKRKPADKEFRKHFPEHDALGDCITQAWQVMSCIRVIREGFVHLAEDQEFKGLT